MNTRVMYLRESYAPKTNRAPVGCVVINVDKHNANYAVTTQNPKDEFEKPLARQLALGRCVESPFNLQVADPAKPLPNMHQVSRAVMSDIVSRKVVVSYKNASGEVSQRQQWAFPTRARKAAQTWLRQQQEAATPELTADEVAKLTKQVQNELNGVDSKEIVDFMQQAQSRSNKPLSVSELLGAFRKHKTEQATVQLPAVTSL